MQAKHKRFLYEYLSCFNGREAYQRIYPNSTPEAAMNRASQLLADPEIKAELEKLMAIYAMPKLEVLDKLREIGRSTLAYFFEMDTDGNLVANLQSPQAQRNFHLIKKITTKNKITRKTTYDKQTEQEITTETIEQHVSIELHEKLRALELMGKHQGLFDERIEITGAIGQPGEATPITFNQEESNRIAGILIDAKADQLKESTNDQGME